jgi:hypothetical protein
MNLMMELVSCAIVKRLFLAITGAAKKLSLAVFALQLAGMSLILKMKEDTKNENQ